MRLRMCEMQLRRARFLVIRMNHMPGRVLAGSRLEHHVARPGIVIPASVRLKVHRAQFPLPKRIVYAGLESPFLLILADLQPDLAQPDPAVHYVFLNRGTQVEEALVLRSVQKPMTYSTPARLYQLRSKMMISPA